MTHRFGEPVIWPKEPACHEAGCLSSSDSDGDHLTIDDVGTCSPCGEAWIDPSGGSVWFLATYCQPFLGGTARFTYTISDGHGGADTATVVIGLPDSGTMPEVAPPQGGDR